MALNPQAGKLPQPDQLTDIPALISSYYTFTPDPDIPDQSVSFGTSGHRGSSLHTSFNEAHILAVTQAVCDIRKAEGITGPLFLGKDPHALSEPAWRTARRMGAKLAACLEVCAVRRTMSAPARAMLRH